MNFPMKKKFIILILAVTLSLLQTEVFAQQSKTFPNRGELISRVVQGFDLKTKHKAFLADCLAHRDECFFVFTIRSDFDNLSLDPLLLYPDVSIAYIYYDDINVASMLGLVQGYLDYNQSPFRPRAYMSRIQALKVILGAGGLINWKERFELAEENLKKQQTPFDDVSSQNDFMWWYPRYVNLALEKGIIDSGKYFRPDENITETEFTNMLNRTLKNAGT
jgi:hypothetical protein